MDSQIDSLILDQAAVVVLNPDNTILRWSSALTTLYGWIGAEAVGKDIHALLGTEYPRPPGEIEAALLRDGSWMGELVQRRKNGTPVTVTSRWVVVLSTAGEVTGRLHFNQDITAAKDLAARLNAVQERFDAILESVTDTHILFDREWHYLYVNQAAVDGIGREREAILGRTLWELYPDVAGTALERMYRRAMDERLPVIFDYYYPIHDSWWNNRFFPAPEGLAVFASNITERKRAEEKGRAAEVFTRATLDALPSHICVIDPRGVILSTNQAWRDFARLNGSPARDAYLGANYLAVCDGAQGKEAGEAHAFAEGIRRVLRHEAESFSLEYSCDAPGENRWFIGTVTRFKAGGQNGLVISHVNITERKQAEQKFYQLTRRYQDLFENSGTHIVIVDENGKFLLINANAAANLGRPRAEIIGRTMADFLPPETAARYLDLNRALLKTGGSREYEDTFHLPAGDKTFLIMNQCMQDDAGRNFAIQSSSIDITARKKSEEALRESRERLTRLSHYLVETQEQERRRIARELHDEIGQTLTALTIAQSGLSKTAGDPAFIRGLDNLKSLTHDLAEQVGALSSELRPRVLDDLGLVPGLIALINRLAAQTGIEFDFKHGPMEQRSIPSEIETTAYRIIQESLTNIIRHSEVKLAVVRVQIDGGTLWIQVQDSGAGFDYAAAVIATGSMGLMSMRERAELVGGTFAIQTAPGEGTSITCRLPLAGKPLERREGDRG